MSEEIVKGVSRVELMARYEAGDDIDFLFKELAEKHSNAVLEDYIKTHSAKSDTVSTTYPLETKFKVGISAGHSDGYGRVYSDLEGEIEKRSSAKTEVSRETHKNKYGIGQKVFVINQNDISECVIQDISDGEDGIEYVAYDDYGCDFKLMEKEVITTIEQLVNYVKKLAQTFK